MEWFDIWCKTGVQNKEEAKTNEFRFFPVGSLGAFVSVHHVVPSQWLCGFGVVFFVTRKFAARAQQRRRKFPQNASIAH